MLNRGAGIFARALLFCVIYGIIYAKEIIEMLWIGVMCGVSMVLAVPIYFAMKWFVPNKFMDLFVAFSIGVMNLVPLCTVKTLTLNKLWPNVSCQPMIVWILAVAAAVIGMIATIRFVIETPDDYDGNIPVVYRTVLVLVVWCIVMVCVVVLCPYIKIRI